MQHVLDPQSSRVTRWELPGLNGFNFLLENALGKKAVIDRQPPQPGDVPITFANIAKAREKLGYNPQVKIEGGIPKFVDWFRTQGTKS